MNILAYDLYPDHNFAREEQIVYTSLDELYHNSDIISLHWYESAVHDRY